MARKNIRNFCIIAHIDHGKSTLSDRMLELTDSVDKRTMTDQVLDDMDIEKERGITIKARAVTMRYKADDGETYEFNLIDTPGHVDFQYEVSRSLAACEGAVLVVDASQGVEAQTLANCYLALDHNLEVVPILNKIDLPSADPDAVAKEVEDVIGLPCMEAPRVSAKLGIGVKEVLESVARDIPAPTGDPDAPLKALIFDSIYDSYKGVIVYVRIFEGTVKPGDTIRLMSTGAEFQLVEVGHMGATSLTPCDKLEAGEVGYLTASIKTVRDTRVGDTVTLAANPTPEPMPGFRTVTPMVFCGIYPADGADYPDLKDALEKLQLNDASLTFEPETSAALGFGFRCGFLGLLHMEIITERLEREFDLDLITTTPGVQYRLTLTDGTVEVIDNPSAYPDPTRIVKQEEPFVNAHIYTPNDYVGPLMDLCQTKRGVLVDMKYMDETRVDLHYLIPLGEIVYDFFDAIKSRSRGYASYDYEWEGWHESKLVRLDFLLNGEVVDALSMIVFADNAYAKGRRICEKLKENIPRALFEIPVQAAVGGKVIARETVKAMRKDVLAKCYGGDITRKKKLLEKQKEGKKKMRQLGSVTLPSEAFTAVLKLENMEDGKLDGLTPESFRSTNESIARVTGFEPLDAKTCRVTLEGLANGSVEITAALDGHVARLMVSVTAELTIRMSDEIERAKQITVNEAATVPLGLAALDRGGKALTKDLSWTVANAETGAAQIVWKNGVPQSVRGIGAGETTLLITANYRINATETVTVSRIVPVTVLAKAADGTA